MKKIKMLLIGLVLFAASAVSANSTIRTYRHTPCDSWSFNGTCTFKGFSTVAAEGPSVQRALDRLERKISNLELQMEVLIEENIELKEKLNTK